jgi:hypothetical protein
VSHVLAHAERGVEAEESSPHRDHDEALAVAVVDAVVGEALARAAVDVVAEVEGLELRARIWVTSRVDPVRLGRQDARSATCPARPGSASVCGDRGARLVKFALETKARSPST